MRKILPFLVIGILVLSGLGASALQSYNKGLDIELVKPQSSTSARDYTHTVFVEVCTATWCPSCPASNAAWHSIYGSGNYDFEYTELVYDMNSVANSRKSQFNLKWVPTSFWDGGEYVYPGTNTGTFYSYLDSSGARTVPDLVATLDVSWLGGAEIEISYNVDNNDASNYPGRLRIYVIELESTLWNDYSGNPYYHAFLDFAENKDIDIPAAGTISDTITWDGASSGYPGITSDNIQVILAVFGDTPHQSYSDPPSGNPFWAYYSDECIASEPLTNQGPGAPTISGPLSGSAGTSYDFSFNSVDPDGDDVYYYVIWDDGNVEMWDGPHASGVDADIAHTFASQGTYTVKAKAKDGSGVESGWAELIVTMPRNKAINTLFQRIIQQFPIIKQILGL